MLVGWRTIWSTHRWAPFFRVIPVAILLVVPVCSAAVDTGITRRTSGATVHSHQLIDLGDSTLLVSIQASPATATINQQKTLTWLTSAARSVTTIYGHFPLRHTQILVTPVASTSATKSPVIFGQVNRQPDLQVRFFVDPNQPLASYLSDWTAAHEFAHLMLPFINRDAAWLSEGIATYYQYVARVRAGIISQQQAWNRLLAGLERGRHNSKNKTSLRQTSQQMHQQKSYMRVYWSGVVYALSMDVQLRQQTNNQQSLDQALFHFYRCCLPSQRPWDGIEFLNKLDFLMATTQFSENYHRYANDQEFPLVTELLNKLGVASVNGSISLDDQAPLAFIRHQIMAVAVSPEAALEPRPIAGQY